VADLISRSSVASVAVGIVAAWMTHRIGAGSRPADVATAEPGSIGPCAIASRSISGPPAALIAPATPPPIHRSWLAAFTLGSTGNLVRSPTTTSISISNERTNRLLTARSGGQDYGGARQSQEV